jgi:hypothetical protein
VRCGRCSEVFNAAEALLDLDTGSPRGTAADAQRSMVKFGPSRPSESLPSAAVPSPSPSPSPFASASASPPFFPSPPPPPPPALADFGLKPPRRREPELSRDQGNLDSAPMPTMDEAVSRFSEDAAEAVEAAYATDAVDPAAAPAPTADDIRAEPRKTRAAASATPSFLRQAERAARWRRPRVRAALAATVVVGVAGLTAQLGLEYRDLVAARFPALRPVLQAACQPLNCSVGPAHVIESLVVESSGLVRVEKSSVYRLSVALRNRAALEVALPALELSLTDGQGKLVARRVLSASEFGVNQATLGAGRELQLQATLQAATAPVAGYTIELFYP